MKKKDKFEELACDVKNEDDCEEELDLEVVDKDDVEKEHFGESDDLRSGEIE